MEIVNELLSNQSDYLNALRNAQQMPQPKENVITKREQFAAMAMQGLLANSNPECDYDLDFESLAQDAVLAADILLWELNKEPKEYTPDLKP